MSLTVSTKTAVKIQQSFEKTKDVERGESVMLLREWDNEYDEASQLSNSSYANQKNLF